MTRSRDIANLLGSSSAIIDGAPSNLNTLNEIAAAINDDPSFSTTVDTALSGKEKSIPLQSSAPSSPSTSDMWVDNTNPVAPVLKIYNGSAWITVAGGGGGAADDDQTILASRVFA